jgi:uncharacterized protein (DUF1015 family)
LVIPFVGERYSGAERFSELMAPPYDVISLEQRKIYRERNEHNIVRLILPGGNGDRYTHAATILASWRKQGVLVREEEESVYVVRQEFETPDGEPRVRTGVIGAVAVEPFSSGRVRPHERTHVGPKEDRLALLRATRAMFEALLMISRDSAGTLQDGLEAATRNTPDMVGVVGGATVSVWRIVGDEGRALAAAASADDAVYIADGHHRYETANTYRSEVPEADRTLALIVPLGDPGLTVLPTHRIVFGDPVDRAVLEDRLGGDFEMKQLASTHEAESHLQQRKDRARCVVYLPGPTYLGLELKAGAGSSGSSGAADPEVRALDIVQVDNLVVDILMDMVGSRAKVEYDPSVRSVLQRVYSEGAVAAVLVNPADVEQVLSVADAGGCMPQKSTYFEPKVPSGLVILAW